MGQLIDIEVAETYDGGDFVKKGMDLSVISDWRSMPYLAMFGGNVEQSTPVSSLPENTERQDYWANSLFWPDDRSKQFNSETERTLREVALTQDGISQIEDAMMTDLEFMQDFAEIRVNARLLDVNELELTVFAREPENLEEAEFRYIWRPSDGSLSLADFDVTAFSGQIRDFSHDDFASNDFA